jgi:hypothetical protein
MEEGSLDYDGGIVRLQVQLKFDMNIHRQHRRIEVAGKEAQPARPLLLCSLHQK